MSTLWDCANDMFLNIEYKKIDYFQKYGKDPLVCHMGREELDLSKAYTSQCLKWDLDLKKKGTVVTIEGMKVIAVDKDEYLEVG
jgi:hypothetical protein